MLENLAKTMEGPKKTKVFVPKRWRVPTNTKKQSCGVLSCQTTQCSNTLLFCFFGTLQRFGTKTLVSLGPLSVLEAFWSKAKVLVPKRWRVQKKKSWSLELPNYPTLQNLVCFGLFGTVQRFGTKTLVLLGPLQNAPKTLPKPWRVPKKPRFWCQNAGGYQKNPKKTKFWSLELPSKTLFFVFWYPPAILIPIPVLTLLILI